MKALDLAPAHACPVLADRMRGGRARPIALAAMTGQSPVLHPDGLRGCSPALAIARTPSPPPANRFEHPPYLVSVAAAVAVAIVFGGVGVGYWTYLKTEARHRIAAYELTVDRDGLRAAIAGGHAGLIADYARLGVRLGDTSGVIAAALESADPAVLSTVMSGGATFANEGAAGEFIERAVQSGDPRLLAALLSAGANPEDPAFGGPQSLARLAADAHQWDVLRWVLANRPTEADFADPQGNRLAHYIAFSGVADLVPLAHDRWGVDFAHATANNGASALHVAAYAKAAAMVTALLAQGCDPLYETPTLLTPLAVAVRSGDDATLAAFVTSPRVVQRLLADPGLTAIVDAGMTDTVTALVTRAQLPANTVLDNRVSLLGEAVAKHREALVAALLEHGADPNEPFVYSNVEGVTPLMLAAVQGLPASVKALLDHGASRTATAQNGFSVTLAAQRSGNGEVQALLGVGE